MWPLLTCNGDIQFSCQEDHLMGEKKKKTGSIELGLLILNKSNIVKFYRPQNIGELCVVPLLCWSLKTSCPRKRVEKEVVPVEN